MTRPTEGKSRNTRKGSASTSELLTWIANGRVKMQDEIDAKAISLVIGHALGSKQHWKIPQKPRESQKSDRNDMAFDFSGEGFVCGKAIGTRPKSLPKSEP